MDHETRTFGFEVREMDSATGEFSGYASVFGNLIPYFNERVKPGAFKKTIKENAGKVPIMYGHYDWIGFGQDALEDSTGLKVRGKLRIDKVKQAEETWALMEMAQEAKKPTGLSIGFRAIKFNYVKEDGFDYNIREITEAQLLEYSVTPFPANEQARITDMRSSVELLYRRKLITSEQRQKALADMQAASGPEPDVLHSIYETLRKQNDGLRDISRLIR